MSDTWQDGTNGLRAASDLVLFENVRNYGAVGDGVTVDTVAFQNAALAAAGKALYVPGGYEFLVGDVELFGQTRIFGDYGSISGFPVASSVIKAAPGATRVLDGRDKYGITIENVWIDGNNVALYGIDLSNSTLGGANQHRVTNVSVTGTTTAAMWLDNAGETEVRGCRTDQLASGWSIHWLNQAGNSTIDGGSYFDGPMFVDAQIMQIANCSIAGLYISPVCEQLLATNCYIYQETIAAGTTYCVNQAPSLYASGVGPRSVTFDTCRFIMKNGLGGQPAGGAVIRGPYSYYVGFLNCFADMVGTAANPDFFANFTSEAGAGNLIVEFAGGKMNTVAGKCVTWNPDYSEYEVRESLLDHNFNFLSNRGTRSIRMREQTDFGAPGANEAILYTRDNGSGKTQIVARFATGAIQVIATQP